MTAARQGPIVAILADDLIWSSRLEDALVAAGARTLRTRRLDDLRGRLERGDAGHAVIDLTARAYDGIEAVRVAAAAGARVVAVGQHDDLSLRKRALDAGAERVYAYRALFEAGPAKLGQWLATDPEA